MRAPRVCKCKLYCCPGGKQWTFRVMQLIHTVQCQTQITKRTFCHKSGGKPNNQPTKCIVFLQKMQCNNVGSFLSSVLSVNSCSLQRLNGGKCRSILTYLFAPVVYHNIPEKEVVNIYTCLLSYIM